MRLRNVRVRIDIEFDENKWSFDTTKPLRTFIDFDRINTVIEDAAWQAARIVDDKLAVDSHE